MGSRNGWAKAYSVAPPPCIHCQRPTRLVKGKEIYSKRSVAEVPFWHCEACQAHCGCHKGTEVALGYPANRELRRARSILHGQRLDPLWKVKRPGTDKPPFTRAEVYHFLSEEMGLSPEDTHVGMFTLVQCRIAWVALGRLIMQIENGEI